MFCLTVLGIGSLSRTQLAFRFHTGGWLVREPLSHPATLVGVGGSWAPQCCGQDACSRSVLARMCSQTCVPFLLLSGHLTQGPRETSCAPLHTVSAIMLPHLLVCLCTKMCKWDVCLFVQCVCLRLKLKYTLSLYDTCSSYCFLRCQVFFHAGL